MRQRTRPPGYGRLAPHIEEARAARARGDTYRAIAARYGVDFSAVHHALKRGHGPRAFPPSQLDAVRACSRANAELYRSSLGELVCEIRASVRRSLRLINQLREARGALPLKRRHLYPAPGGRE